MVFKSLCVLVLWGKAASALEGLRVPPEVAVWIYNTFDDNLGIESYCTKYLNECCTGYDLINISLSNIFLLCFRLQDFIKSVRLLLAAVSINGLSTV